jgi:mono/diheme cytochrome c family protein
LLLALAAVLALGVRGGGPAQAEGDASLSPEVLRLAPPAGPSWGALDVGAAPDDPARAARGAALYALRCAACHGFTARGDGLFAPDLPRQPRDLVAAPLRTRDRAGPVSEAELFRTITVGAPAYGMPSFEHLPPLDRWALAAFVRTLREDDRDAAPGPALLLPAAPPIDLELGRATFAQQCAVCHGGAGDGKSPAGAALVDTQGRPAPALDFTRGPAAFRGGARPEDVARTVSLGRPGTGMAPIALEPDALWSVAAYVSGLATEGLLARQRAWDTFFADRRAGARADDQTLEPESPRWDPRVSASFAVAPDGRRGCTSCHGGIAEIASGTMAQAIDAFAGGDADRSCVVCHEGRPDAAQKAEAHEGMLGNPGSLWATSVGLGCGKCHSDRGALTSLHGRPLPEATGGALLTVRSRQTDPTGASGANHAYRMQRALMAQETGKVYLFTASTGLVERDAPRFTDFDVDDPDGPVPCAGSPDYRAAMARAYETGHVQRLSQGEGFPTFAEARALTNSEAAAAYADVYRKECGRCHLWGEGKAASGEHRSAGCSACHVLTNRTGTSEGGDPTTPTNRAGHPIRHRLELAIPEQQCNHCHTRGAETMHTDGHQLAGIGCVDCHTSIDVHGDGNLYPSINHQLEVKCEDCHGTPTQAPWELPLFPGTKAEGDRPRGVHGQDGQEHLLTSRGNARTNWLRRGERAVMKSFLDGSEHEVPLLRDRVADVAAVASPTRPSATASAHAQVIPGHDALSCAACHSSKGPSCTTCHIDYFASARAQDYLLSALDHDPATLRQRPIFTPGAIEQREEGTSLGNPHMRPDRAGRLQPQVPGCQPDLRYIPPKGSNVLSFVPRMTPGSPGYPPPIAPTLTHERSVPARTCVACHVDGE